MIVWSKSVLILPVTKIRIDLKEQHLWFLLFLFPEGTVEKEQQKNRTAKKEQQKRNNRKYNRKGTTEKGNNRKGTAEKEQQKRKT